MMTVMIMMTVTAEESVQRHFEVGKYAHIWGQTSDDVHSMGSFLSSSSIWVLLLSIIILVVPIEEIEITSWKARAYGIFTQVGEVSEIERDF